MSREAEGSREMNQQSLTPGRTLWLPQLGPRALGQKALAPVSISVQASQVWVGSHRKGSNRAKHRAKCDQPCNAAQS